MQASFVFALSKFSSVVPAEAAECTENTVDCGAHASCFKPANTTTVWNVSLVPYVCLCNTSYGYNDWATPEDPLLARIYTNGLPTGFGAPATCAGRLEPITRSTLVSRYTRLRPATCVHKRDTGIRMHK